MALVPSALAAGLAKGNESMSTMKPPLVREDACILMHTALRKCCDSRASANAYNVIHLICALRVEPRGLDPWLVLGENVAGVVNGWKSPLTGPHLKECTEALEDLWHERMRQHRGEQRQASEPEHARNALYALLCAFRMFDASDWAGMATYLAAERSDS